MNTDTNNAKPLLLLQQAFDALEATADSDIDDLASPILNKVKAEALNNAADWFNLNYHDDTAALRLRELADAIEKGEGL